MNVRLQKKDSDSKKKPSTLEIRLEKTSKRNSSRALAPRFPKVSLKAYHIICFEVKTKIYLHKKIITFTLGYR